MAHEISVENRSFLIVDDEPFSRDIVRRMLVDLNPRQLDTAGNGAEALGLLQRDDALYDCVITDFSMEPINGLELLKMIRSGTARIPRHLPVIMLTGHSDAELIGTAIALDAHAFLAKPVARNILCDRLARVIADPGPIRPAIAYSVIQTGSGRAGRADARDQPKGMALQSDFEDQNAARMPLQTRAPTRREAQFSLFEVPPDSVLSRGFVTKNGTMLLAPDSVLTRRMLNRLRDVTALESVVSDVWVYVDEEA